MVFSRPRDAPAPGCWSPTLPEPRATFTFRQGILFRLGATLALGAIGFWLNSVRLSVLGEGTPEFVFGGATSLVAFVWLGPLLGALATLISLSFFVVERGMAGFAALIYLAETWAVWVLSSRLGNLAAASAVFWLTAGVLLDRIIYAGFLGLSNAYLMLLLVKQLLNGFLNAVAAEASLVVLPSGIRKVLGTPAERFTLQGYVFRRVLFVVLLPIVLLALLYTTSVYQRRLDEARAAQLRTASNLRLAIETLLSEREEALTRLARVIELSIALNDGSLRQEVEQFAVSHPEFRGVGVIDREGLIKAVFHNGRWAEEMLGASAAERRYFRRARETARVATPEVVVGSQHATGGRGEPILVVAPTLLDQQGGFAGIVYGVLAQDELTTLAGDSRTHPEFHTTIFDAEQVVVASTDPQLRPGTPMARHIDLRALDPSRTGVFSYNPPSDGSLTAQLEMDFRYAAYQPLRAPGWGLLVELTLEGLQRQVLPAVYWVLGLLSGTIVLVYGLAVIVSKHASKPLTRIGSIAAHIASGRFPGWEGLRELTEHPIEEIRSLGSDLLTMQDRLMDVQALSQARERESEERFSATFHQAAVGLGHLDLEGRWLRVNGRLGAILARPAALLVGQPMAALVSGDDRDASQAMFAALLAGERSVGTLEMQYDRSGGGQVVTQTTASLVRDASGGGKYFILVVEDVTERKRLERELREAQKMETVGRLAGGVAHDFNNMLTAIIGYSEMLERRVATDGEALAQLRQIREAGDRAKHLTQQLLAFARRQVIEPRVVDLNGLVREMEAMLRRLIGEHIALESDLDPALASVRADPGQIGQVILNLVVNARDAIEGTGTIVLSTRLVSVRAGEAGDAEGLVPGEYVELVVADSGSGMSGEVRAHIFEPFFTTKTRDRGTGLGLATCYGIVHQSGGHILVESEVGHGSRFRVRLPAVAERPEAPTPHLREPAAAGAERILLAEDERAVANMAAAVLRSRGYDVVLAANGVEALDAWEREEGRFDLLVTDVVMPQMGGSELATALWLSRPGLRVVFMSGYAFETMPNPVHEGRTATFLQKPFTPGSLAEAVRTLLDTAEQPVTTQPVSSPR